MSVCEYNRDYRREKREREEKIQHDKSIGDEAFPEEKHFGKSGIQDPQREKRNPHSKEIRAFPEPHNALQFVEPEDKRKGKRVEEESDDSQGKQKEKKTP